MREAVFSNTNGTLVIDPMDRRYGSPEFITAYVNAYGLEEFNNYTDAKPEMKEHKRWLKKQMGIPDLLYPHARELLAALDRNGLDLVIFAAADPEKSREIYGGLEVRIADAYQADGELKDRSDPVTFVKLRDAVKGKYDPKAYLTHRITEALASAEAWRKGLLCGKDDTGRLGLSKDGKEIGIIYAINWDDMRIGWEIEKMIRFLRE